MAVMTQNRTSQTTEDQSVVDRLSIEKIEKTVLLHTVQQEGFELGIRSSSKLSDQDFRHFDRVSTIAADLDGDALDSLWAFLDFKGYPQQARLHDPDFAQLLAIDAQSRIVFAQGWVDGVLSVWQTLQCSLNDSPEQSALAERLYNEKTELLHKVQQEGFELGIRSGSQLSDQDFRHFNQVKAVAAHLDEDAFDYLWTFLDFKGYPQQARFHHPELAQLLEVDAQSRIAFVQSWVEGVLSVGDMENGEWRIKY